MDFALTEEQEMLRAMFRDFAGREVAKLADEADKQETLPQRLLQRSAAQGFLGALAPEEPYGGAGLDTVGYTLMLEALAAESASLALLLHVHNGLALRTILMYAGHDLRARLVPELITGARLGAFALAEADAGSDRAHLCTTARSDGSGWALDGVKAWVTNSGLAGVYVVFAASSPAAGVQGLSAFAVPADTAGLTVGVREPTLGLRSACMGRLYLDACWVPNEYLLGAEGQGWQVAQASLEFDHIGGAAIALGLGRRALEMSTRYASERMQFGAAIGYKQAIQMYLADAQADVAAAGWLVRHAAWLADQGRPFRQEAAVAKLFCSRMAARVTNQAVQIHGGAGYVEDYPVERCYRDARALEIIAGTSQLQQIAIAQSLLAGYGIKVEP